MLVAGQRVSGRADRVDPIVLGLASSLERTNFNDRLTRVDLAELINSCARRYPFASFDEQRAVV